MRFLVVVSLMLGCHPSEPVRTPDSSIPSAQPTIEPIEIEPTPEPRAVSMPASVESGEPFVIEYCGPQFEERVSILFDGRYPAGGLMGWSNGCKRQTINGLNTSGNRTLQFVVDDDIEPTVYRITVL